MPEPETNVIQFPTRSSVTHQECDECGSLIVSSVTRIFCDGCIEMHDGAEYVYG